MINFKNYLNLILNESVSDEFKKFLKNSFKVFIEHTELSDLLSTFSFYREIKKDFNDIGLDYANFIIDFCNDNKSLFPNFMGIDCQAIKDINLAYLYPYDEDEKGLVKIEKGSECFINRLIVDSNAFYLFGPTSFSGSDYYTNALLRHCYDSGNCAYIKHLQLLGMHISHYGDTTVIKKVKNLLDFQKSTVLHKLKELTNNDFYDFYNKEVNKITESKSIKWINKNIYDTDKLTSAYISCTNKIASTNSTVTAYNKEQFENTIDGDINDPNHINNVMDRLQKTTPELVESLKILNTLDMDAVNGLLNKLNSFTGTFEGVTGK